MTKPLKRRAALLRRKYGKKNGNVSGALWDGHERLVVSSRRRAEAKKPKVEDR